ncbi:hypothetical protein LAZ67_3004485 [Cordylochernes scorpioides]|uniref:RNA-directed DNA polymerase n=1 Tax=Cordylochernes scorpioides TaxID=51811 RepID=A0ABY6KA75_9ARAC|nr:hypothetical protein LAZ67_3004485 [Cordylochernes scorpioides]
MLLSSVILSTLTGSVVNPMWNVLGSRGSGCVMGFPHWDSKETEAGLDGNSKKVEVDHGRSQSDHGRHGCPTSRIGKAHDIPSASLAQIVKRSGKIDGVKGRGRGNILIAQKPYRTSFYNNAEIQKQITELLRYNNIRPLYSPYSSPALLVNKKSDAPNHPTRLCINYRKLNQKTVPEHTPIPLIEQIIDRLSQSKIYTILDVKNAYWHIPIDEKDRHKTSFVTQLGCYEWNRLPYGLKIAPSQFERIMKAPMNEPLLKNAPWLWSAKHEQAFQTLENSLISQPVPYIYDPSKPCHLFTNALSLGVAGVLKQPDEQGILHPIGYFSRKLHLYEQNYTASEIETLAIINSVQRFHTFLHNIHFTLHTDHLPLKWIKNVKNPQGRLFRWSLILSQYSYDIKHIKGSNNIEAYMLSRAPVSFSLTYNELKEHQSKEQINNSKIKIQNDIFIINRKGFKRAYVPQTLGHRLLNKVYTKHGHIGTTQMTKIISPHYYWPHMTRDIANYTKHCETCQFDKYRDNRIDYRPLQQMPIATHTNHIFSLDTLGGLHNYGTTRHSFTPKFLYYGKQPQYIEHDTETHIPIEKARKLAIERTIKSHEHNKQLYDIKHPEPIFKKGDQENHILDMDNEEQISAPILKPSQIT